MRRDARRQRVGVRLRPAERALAEATAEVRETTVSGVLRDALRREVRRELAGGKEYHIEQEG